MPTFIALWPSPDEDAEGFVEHYQETHVPLAESWPNVQQTLTRRVTADPMGGEPLYEIVFTADFASQEDLDAAMNSQEMGDTMKDVKDIGERWGIQPTVMFSEEI